MVIAAVWWSQVGAERACPVRLLGPFILLGAGLGFSFMPLIMTVLAGLPLVESGAASGEAA